MNTQQSTSELRSLQVAYIRTKLMHDDLQARNKNILEVLKRDITPAEYAQYTTARDYAYETLQHLLTYCRIEAQKHIATMDNKTADEMYTVTPNFICYAWYIPASWQAKLVATCLSWDRSL